MFLWGPHVFAGPRRGGSFWLQNAVHASTATKSANLPPQQVRIPAPWGQRPGLLSGLRAQVFQSGDTFSSLPVPLFAEHNDAHSTQSNVSFLFTHIEEVITIDDFSVQPPLPADDVAPGFIWKKSLFNEATVTNTAVLRS
ncbi:hypothetical protein HPB50_018451 [Hyalomma asiaticum]|uniref:Uncharacterized protein n=1 Tax=Hyalomma asiaticum TaxID=266040 RepID=A0ACB7SR27_HYAAI|nr:hypothetical protein HPB50_018451 [Hyalomma asiaticum]